MFSLRRLARCFPRPSTRWLTQDAQRPNYAILVDAENAQAASIRNIVDTIEETHGHATIRRLYGDFTQEKLDHYEQVANTLSFKPMHMAAPVKGKGTSDASMIVDAMTLLYTKPHIDGFVLVTSDSDFAPLASHLRKRDKNVIGIASEGQMSKAFAAACSSFMHASASGVTPIITDAEWFRSGKLPDAPDIRLELEPTDYLDRRFKLAANFIKLASKDPGLHDTAPGNIAAATLRIKIIRMIIGDVLLASQIGSPHHRSYHLEGWIDLTHVGLAFATRIDTQEAFCIRSFGHKSWARLFEAHPKHFEIKYQREVNHTLHLIRCK